MTPDADNAVFFARHAALEGMALGVVRCAFSPAPDLTARRLLEMGVSRRDGDRVAAQTVDLSKPVFEYAAELVKGLASVALTVWPDWYGRSDLCSTVDERAWQAAFDRLDAAHAASQHRSVLRAWVEQVIPLCRANQPPMPTGFTPTTQVQQLALAIADNDLTLLVEVANDATADTATLMGLARNLEWLARHTGARVVAVLPLALGGRPELEGISWGSWTELETETVRTVPRPNDEPALLVSPIRGRPHPNSPGEKKLAERIALDPHLGPLFEHNTLVNTTRGSRYRVDVVWLAGKIVVEIDGYGCHSSRDVFAADRHRDYELQLSGYLVLRMPHDSVMDDVELAIDKIRDFVKLRTNTDQPKDRPNE